MSDKLYETNITQSPIEIAAFVELLQRENVTRFLEIGSRWGGSLWQIGCGLPPRSRIVSVDSGAGMGGGKAGATESLRACVEQLRQLRYDARLIWGDSRNPETIETARANGPYDAVFIDGGHELDVVTSDWENYGPLAPIVAFHDIAWIRPQTTRYCAEVDVPKLWQELRTKYRHREFIDPPWNMGIGVLWR